MDGFQIEATSFTLRKTMQKHLLTVNTAFLILMLIIHINGSTCINQIWTSSGHPVS